MDEGTLFMRRRFATIILLARRRRRRFIEKITRFQFHFDPVLNHFFWSTTAYGHSPPSPFVYRQFSICTYIIFQINIHNSNQRNIQNKAVVFLKSTTDQSKWLTLHPTEGGIKRQLDIIKTRCVHICRFLLWPCHWNPSLQLWNVCFDQWNISLECCYWVNMLLFCPTCGNLLLVEESANCLRFSCGTCPYISNITRVVKSRNYPKLKVNWRLLCRDNLLRCLVTNLMHICRKWTLLWAVRLHGTTLIQPMLCALPATTLALILCKCKRDQPTSQARLSINAVMHSVRTTGVTKQNATICDFDDKKHFKNS